MSFRSAVTGRFVSVLFALRHPRETVRERKRKPKVAHIDSKRRRS